MTEEQIVALLPCPFCGSPAELDTRQGYRALSAGEIGNRIAVYCTRCPADIGVCIEDVPDIDASQVVDMWNCRAIPLAKRPTGRTIPDLTKMEHVCEWQSKVRAQQKAEFPFEAACSGLRYSTAEACGEVAAIHIDGKRFAVAAQQKAEPVIGVRFYAHKSPATGLWCVSFDGDGSRYDLEEYDTEAEAIKFIDSCRPKQEPADHITDAVSATQQQSNALTGALNARNSESAKEGLIPSVGVPNSADQRSDEPVCEVLSSDVHPVACGKYHSTVVSDERLSVGAELFIRPQRSDGDALEARSIRQTLIYAKMALMETAPCLHPECKQEQITLYEKAMELLDAAIKGEKK